MLSPFFLIVTIGLFFANEGKPFFFQLRPGKHGVIFKIVKFKTMNDKKDVDGICCQIEQKVVWEAILNEYKILELE